MPEETTKVVVHPTGDKVTILHGQAPKQLPLTEPECINITGNIKAVSAFVGVRKACAHGVQVLDPAKVLVSVDKAARTISLNTDPENVYNTIVTGRLEVSDDLKPFCINQEKLFDRATLLKLIRFNKALFEDGSKHAALVESLQRVAFKTQAQLEQESNNKGRIRDLIDKSVDAGAFIDKFILSAPIFKGEGKVKFTVEINYDATDTGVIQFWLESVELKEQMDNALDTIFERELTCCSDYVVIHK